MTMTSFPWDKKSPSAHWEKQDGTSFPWQNPPEDKAKFPWEARPSASLNPLDSKKSTLPWEKSSVPAPENLFLFGKPESKAAPAAARGGSYSSFYNEKRATFPWEKEVEEDSLEAQLAGYLNLRTDKTSFSDESGSKEESKFEAPWKIESSNEIKPTKDIISEKPSEIEAKDQTKLDIKLQSKQPPPKPEKTPEKVSDDDPPITSPVGSPPKLSRSTSVTKLAKKDTPGRIKSAPAVPRHINRKSEMLARNYLSAYAKPKIALTKPEDHKAEANARRTYRKDQSISEWVYPTPTEPVDWKTKSDQNISHTKIPETESTSLREAAFNKWIAVKKHNKTYRKTDVVTVLKDVEDMPSAEDIRQEKFEEWYRSRAIEVDKKTKEQLKSEEKKNKDEEDEAVEKQKQDQISRKHWDDKDKERKKKILTEKAEETKKIKEKEDAENERKKNADKTFDNWKGKKDPKLREETKKKRLKVKQKEEDDRNEQELKEIEAQKSFKAWKEAKEEELKEKQEKELAQKKQEQRHLALQKREKDTARAQALQQWGAQKELEKNKVSIPQHISPWKGGATPHSLISRDDKLMADIKFKKMRQRRQPEREETEVDFVR